MHKNFTHFVAAGLLICLISILPMSSSIGQGTKIDWAQDLDFLAAELPKRHINLFAKRSEPEFRQSVATLKEKIASSNDLQMTLGLMRIVTSIGDEHTGLIPSLDSCQFLPLQFYWFPEGIHIVAATSELGDLVQAKVLAVGGKSIDELVDELKLLLPHDNQSQLKNLVAQHLSNATWLHGIGAVPDIGSALITAEINGRQFDTIVATKSLAEVKQTNWKTVTHINQPQFLRKPQLAHWNDWIADQKTIYFKYNRCEDRPGFQQLVKGTAGFIQLNDVQRFVLDLRHNSGGDSSIFAPLHNYLRDNQKLNQKNRLFVIIGRRTFSSAMLNALEMRDTNATFVGEPTGGRPNHFGEIRLLTLPSSGLQVSYSTKYFQTIKGADPDSFEPDILVEMTLADWAAGKDPVLEKIFEIANHD